MSASKLLVAGGVLAGLVALTCWSRCDTTTLAATPLAPTASLKANASPVAHQSFPPTERDEGATAPVVQAQPSVSSVMREEHDPEACLSDPEGEPAVQLVALRKLERDDPARAVELAYSLLESKDRQLRTNAIAILARDDSPKARDALSQLDPRSRHLATVLANRR